MSARADVISEKEKFALIEVIRSFAPIWNPEDARYKDLHVRRSCWAGVAEELCLQFGKQYNIVDLQKTYRNLRDTCVRKRRDIQKLHTRRSGVAVDEYQNTVTWPFYKAMWYLESTLDIGRRYSNVEPVLVEDAEEELVFDDVPYQDDVVIESNDVLLEETPSQGVVSGTESYRYATMPRSQRAEIEKGRERKSAADDFKELLNSVGEQDTFDTIDKYDSTSTRLIFIYLRRYSNSKGTTFTSRSEIREYPNIAAVLVFSVSV
ncbi:hypothetical protein Y032_0503g2642 [Ancylostoma ceylanicum]|nr:hypothetical protein Y032_0503g2642 [Ancylostoma ceylanicum]